MTTAINPLSGRLIDIFAVSYPDDDASNAVYQRIKDDPLYDQVSVWRTATASDDDEPTGPYLLIVADESGKLRHGFDFGGEVDDDLLSAGQIAMFVERRARVEAEALIAAGGLPVHVRHDAHYEEGAALGAYLVGHGWVCDAHGYGPFATAEEAIAACASGHVRADDDTAGLPDHNRRAPELASSEVVVGLSRPQAAALLAATEALLNLTDAANIPADMDDDFTEARRLVEVALLAPRPEELSR